MTIIGAVLLDNNQRDTRVQSGSIAEPFLMGGADEDQVSELIGTGTRARGRARKIHEAMYAGRGKRTYKAG